MRDLSRATGISLAGLYYYFESNEKLLYLIQKHTFTTIVSKFKISTSSSAISQIKTNLLLNNAYNLVIFIVYPLYANLAPNQILILYKSS